MFNRHLSLTTRVYTTAAAMLLVAAAYIGYTLHAEDRMAGILTTIIDQRIRMLHITDRLKSTLLTDEAALFDYLISGDSSELNKRQRLSQETVEEIQLLRPLSNEPEVQKSLDQLEVEVRRYASDANRLITYFQQTTLPKNPNLFQVVVWAHDRQNQSTGLGILSDQSRERLSRIDNLCDELIAYNQRELDRERQQVRVMLRREHRQAAISGAALALILALLLSGHSVFLLRPLRALLRGVERVEKGDLDFEIPVRRQDEIGQLTQSFNRMTQTVNSQRQRLIHESITDGLTGLFNVKHFHKLLYRESARALRLRASVSLLMIDIDHFKNLNDTKGHEYGNFIIKTAANKIRETVREIDMVSRYGGDEFAVILPAASAAEARKLADRITSAIADLPFTLSIGGATLPERADTPKALIQIADAALYAAKQAGRARVSWANDAPAVVPTKIN